MELNTSVILQVLVLAAAGLLRGPITGFYVLCIAVAASAYGASLLTLSKIVAGWFDATRGKALGLLFAVASVGYIVHPPLAGAFIEWFGWRQAYLALAVVLALFGLGAALAWVHEHPSAAVLRGVHAQTGAPPGTPQRFSVRAMLLSRTWWAIAAWGALYAFGVNTFMLHLAPMVIERGGNTAQAATAASLLGVGLLLGNLGVGALLDRLPTRALISALMAGPVIAAVLALALPGTYHVLWASALILGMAGGAEASALTYLVSRYFPPESYGRAYAVQAIPLALAAGIGPWVAALLREQSGSYASPLQLSIVLFVIAAAMPWALPARPR